MIDLGIKLFHEGFSSLSLSLSLSFSFSLSLSLSFSLSLISLVFLGRLNESIWAFEAFLQTHSDVPPDVSLSLSVSPFLPLPLHSVCVCVCVLTGRCVGVVGCVAMVGHSECGE